MTLLATMKQALEALEKSNRFVWHYAHSKATARIAEQCDEAITSLRKAIQEEALRNVQRMGQEIEQEKEIHDRHCNQGEWKGVCKYSDPNCPTIADLKSKEPEQEPYGWVSQHTTKGMYEWQFNKRESSVYIDTAISIVPVYTHPPQRAWVGLTDEQVDSWELPDCPTVFEFAQFIEAKLKQKNGFAEEKNT